MAAPEYVPAKPMDEVRAYESPPRRPASWLARRPGDLTTGQPRGARYGNPGPDQGYALKLAHTLRDRVRLQPGESIEDVTQGAVPIALKRASLMGRAPIGPDLLIAWTVWGYLDESPAADLVALRGPLFEEIAHTGYYVERQRLAAMVPPSTLRLSLDEVTRGHTSDWRSLLDLESGAHIDDV